MAHPSAGQLWRDVWCGLFRGSWWAGGGHGSEGSQALDGHGPTTAWPEALKQARHTLRHTLLQPITWLASDFPAEAGDDASEQMHMSTHELIQPPTIGKGERGKGKGERGKRRERNALGKHREVMIRDRTATRSIDHMTVTSSILAWLE
jgi:hypothetical protein